MTFTHLMGINYDLTLTDNAIYEHITSLNDDTSDRLSLAKLISNDDNIEVRKYLVIPNTVLVHSAASLPPSLRPMELSDDFSLCAKYI